MSREITKPSRDELGIMVNKFMLENYSQREREKMINGQCGEGETPCQTVAEAVYANIIEDDGNLRRQFAAFTPHVSCQVSLVRDVLITKRKSMTPALAMAS